VTKAMLLLKFAGLEFSEDRGGYRKAPKGKLPFIDDEGLIVADSTFSLREKIQFRFQRPPLGQSKKCAKTISIWL
jgi:hypothetical protein